MNPVVHFEMPAEDRKRMADFYTKAFDWKTQMLGPDMGDYVLVTTTETDENGMVQKPGTINGGFYTKSKENPVQHPSIVVSVDDINASIQKVVKAGGKVHGGPQEIPGVGQFVYFEDTEGNIASMLQPFPMG